MSVNRTIPHLVLTFILATVQLACGTIVHAQAADDGVEWRPIHEGGNEWIVTPWAFELWAYDDGELTDDGFLLEISDKIRAGCFVTTPWIPVASASEVHVFPGVDIMWTGVQDILHPKPTGIVNFLVEVRPIDQSKYYDFFGIGSSDLRQQPVYKIDDHTMLMSGTLESSVDDAYPFVFNFDVNPSELRVMACTLMPSTQLLLSNIAVQTFPTE